MALIDELKEKRKAANELHHEYMRNAFTWQSNADMEAQRVRDFDTAIAALEPPAPSDETRERIADFKDRYPGFQAEQETAPAPVEIEIPEEGLGSSLIEMGYGDDDIPSEFVEPIEEAPALNADMQDEREQPVEGYAPVTNPEADALARAHDYYSPEKIAERNKFNPFAMFRREPEEVS